MKPTVLVVIDFEGHLKSIIFVIWMAYVTSYQWLIVTLALSCTVSEIWLLIGWNIPFRSALWPFKVIQSHWLICHLKASMRLTISDQ